MKLVISHAPMVGILAFSGMARLADQMAAVIYGWGLLSERGDSLGAGIVIAASFAGLILGTLFAGKLIGAFGARRVAMAGVWLSAAAAITIALLLQFGIADPITIAVLAYAGAILDGPTGIASETNYPEVARLARGNLVRLNAVDDSVDHVAGLIAPAAGAALVSGYGAPDAAVMLAVLSLAAATTLTFALPRFGERRSPSAVPLRQVIGFVRKDTVLFPLAILLSLVLATFVAVELVVLPRMLHNTGEGADSLAIYLLAAGGGGLGGAACASLAQRLSLQAVVVFCFVLMVAALLVPTMGLTTGYLVTAGVLAGLPAGLLAPIVSTAFQTRPPKALRAHVQGVFGALVFAATPAAVMLAAVAADAYAPVPIFQGLAVLMGVVAAVGFVWLTPARIEAQKLSEERIGTERPAQLGKAAGRHAPLQGDPAPSTPAMTGRMYVSLARRSLTYEWRRYLAAVLAVAFSGLLVIVQIGLLLGLFRTVTTVVDRASADLWIGEATVQSFDLARDMQERIEFQVRSHPAVARVERIQLAFADWRAPDGRRVAITLVGLDASAGSLGFPQTLSPHLREALKAPGSIIIDEIDVGKLGFGASDQRRAEINGRRVEAVGVMSGFRAIGGAMIFVSEATFRDLRSGMGGEQDGAAYFLVGLKPGSDRDVVKTELGGMNPAAFRAMLPEELSVMSQSYWLLESGTGIGFLFSTVLGLLVGVAITSQTLRGAVLASLREYATLRALGIPLGTLRRVVLEQSFWVGVAGLVISVAITACIWLIAVAGDIALALTWWAILGTAAFTLTVAVVSGLFSLGPLFKTEPAELLR